MHRSALEIGKSFVEQYVKANSSVLEVGSFNVNGGFREQSEVPINWTGIDITSGPGVDVILLDPYEIPFADNFFDAVVTSSTFEHNAFFWLTFQEMVRVCKEGGVIYVNAPSNGLVHRYPIDSYRFFPDAGISLQDWSKRTGKTANLVESFVASRIPQSSIWNDFVAVFEVESRNLKPVLFEMYDCRNCRIFDFEKGKIVTVNHSGTTEDLDELRLLRKFSKLKETNS